MKKAFTLIELVVSIAVTSIVLLTVFSITTYTSSILLNHQIQEATFDELYLIDKYIENYIDQATSVEVIDESLVIDGTINISFDQANLKLIRNSIFILETKYIQNIEFSKDESLITVLLWISESDYMTLHYYKV
ncbi:type II secretion system protein [Acholeplasma equirhinis]|uniref:type II secretion system protein n=1 Tax=Acholeplasma equirhinis TaxID=555393 RepID=UPI00197AEA5D|nr:type II secretion system protein [Acholeplasma equirhinis]MBN3489906.1 type II secretion system protein [Acholeplasma equirhinis]